MEEQEYWEQIQDHFVSKRGSALILSPRDWPLVTAWQERGIPLEVICEGIDRAFDRLEDKQGTTPRRPIQTLTFCQRDVEDVWEAWQENHPESGAQHDGEQKAFERRKLTAKFRSVANQLHQYAGHPHYACIHADLLSASEHVHALIPLVEQAQEQTELTALKERARELEQQLAATLEQSIPPAIRQRLLANAETRVISHKHRMQAAVYRETLHLAFIQELRNAYPLPSFL